MITNQPSTNLDPREQKKKELEDQQKKQTQTPVGPVSSNLPQMQEQKKQTQPVTYQQRAGAVTDPRFSRALAGKLQQDVSAQQKQFAQQQAQTQQQIGSASAISSSPARINDLLTKIQSGTASDSDLMEYQTLQRGQYEGPQTVQPMINAAALTQLAASPQLLAQKYAGFSAGLSPTQIQQSLSSIEASPELLGARQQAQMFAQQAMGEEEKAAQQINLLKAQTQSAKELAETGVRSAQERYMGELSEEQKKESEAKKTALDRIKAGMFLGEKISSADLKKLGLSKEDLQKMSGLDISKIEGLGAISTVSDLENEVKKLKKKQTESGATPVLTPEQERLIQVYEGISGLQREQDESSVLGYAKKQDLAKINALRKLTGQSEVKQEDLEKGYESGQISKERLSGLIGGLSDLSGKYSGQQDIEGAASSRRGVLSGNTVYSGGLNKAISDVNNVKFGDNDKVFDIAQNMMNQLKKTEEGKNHPLYGFLKKNLTRRNKQLAEDIGNKETDFTKAFKSILNDVKNITTQQLSSQEEQLGKMSNILRSLNIE